MLVEEVLGIMRKNKKHGVLVAAAIGLWGNLQMHDNSLLVSRESVLLLDHMTGLRIRSM